MPGAPGEGAYQRVRLVAVLLAGGDPAPLDQIEETRLGGDGAGRPGQQPDGAAGPGRQPGVGPLERVAH